MKTRHNETGLRFRFDSLQEVQRYLESTRRVWRGRSSENNPACPVWDLDAGWEGALKLARDGWQEGAKALRSAMARLPAMTPAPALVYAVDGIQADIGRVCAGIPECMLRPATEAVEGSQQVITLAVAVNAMADTKARHMANYGTAIAKYIDDLEAAGNQVEVIAAIVSEVSGVRCAHSWTVKRAGGTINLATLAFSIGHPAAFRRFGFGLRERLPRELVQEDSCYGFSVDLKLSDLINPPHGTIILNGMRNAHSVARTPEAALAAVGEQIEAAMTDPEAKAVGGD